MGAKRFCSLADYVRHGMNLELSCSNAPCANRAILDSWSVVRWSKIWRWADDFHVDVMRHFYCSKCGARRPHHSPTEMAPTLLTFFPADERGWQYLQRRIRR